MTPENAARGKANRNKGITAERAVARHFRDHGYPDAERAVRTGFRTSDRSCADPGDITGIPGLIVSVKDCQRHTIDAWLTELDAMRTDDPGALGVLIVKRAGRADPAQWWAWTRLGDITPHIHARSPVCMSLGDFTALHRKAPR